MSDKLKALEERIEKLEHALLVIATWHHGQDEYVKAILGPEAVQCAEVEGDSIDKVKAKQDEDLLHDVANDYLDRKAAQYRRICGYKK